MSLLPAVPLVDGEDSTTISNLSRSTGAVVCYSDRHFKNDDDARAQFPELEKRGRIIALAAATEPPDSPLAGDGVDTEPGNLPPGAAAASIKARIHAGHWRPVGYADLSDMTHLMSNLHMIGVPTPAPGPGRPWRCYTAHPTGIRHICGPRSCGQLPFDADATQWWWVSIQNPGGPDIDKDVFRGDFFPGAKPPPPPPLPQEDIVAITSWVNKDGLAEIACEAQPSGAGKCGQVFHIKQDPGTRSQWWENSDGTPNWLSLGIPS